MCKITNIDTEKERFLVSLKHVDVAGEETMSGPKLMESYFKELEVFGDAPYLEVGTVVDAEVTRITPQGLMVKVENRPGFVPLDTLSR